MSSRIGCGPPRVQQRPVQVVSGTHAWNMAAPPGAAPDTAPAPQPQPAAVEERTMEIWTTPHGFLKAAAANNATSQPADGGSDVSFTVGGKHKYVGRINAQNQVERVQTWIDNTVLGDTPVEITYSDYRDFNGVMFPAQDRADAGRASGARPHGLGGHGESRRRHPVPDQVRSFTPPAVNVEVEKLADGVYYMKGGSHHSVAIDQRDHIVVVEAPQDEARSLAVIAKVKETIPNKPIRYLDQLARPLRPLGRPAHVRGRGRHHRDARDEQAVLRAGVGGAADDQPRQARQGRTRPPRSRRLPTSTC